MSDPFTAACLAAFLTASAGDAVTTLTALPAGAREGNPLMRSPWAYTAVKGAQATTLVFWTKKYQRDHPKVTRTVLLAGTAFYVGLSVHNYHVYQQERGIR
jgi:hypothetical protein